MVQTENMLRLLTAANELLKISEVLKSAGLTKAAHGAIDLSDDVMEEYNRLQIPPAP